MACQSLDLVLWWHSTEIISVFHMLHLQNWKAFWEGIERFVDFLPLYHDPFINFVKNVFVKTTKSKKRSQHDQYIENSQFVWGSRSYQLCQNLRLSPWWPISSLHLWKHKSRPHSISVPFKSKLGQTNLEGVHLHNPTVENSLMSSVYKGRVPCLHFTVHSVHFWAYCKFVENHLWTLLKTWPSWQSS